MRIVIIDDDRLCTKFLSDSIRKVVGDEPEIATYTNPVEAKDNIGRFREPDILFLDIEMPGVSGIELAKEAKARWPYVHVVFVTSTTEHAYTAWKLHVDDYLLKPVRAEELTRVLNHFGLVNALSEYDTRRLNIRCFGKFEVFYDCVPVVFKRKRAKEVFAYIVAARGAEVSTGELCGVLWDDAKNIELKKTYLRQYISSLRAALKPLGCEDAIIHRRDAYSVNMRMVNCDYYRYLKDRNDRMATYMGEFMTQYEWAEDIAAQLEEYIR